MNPKKKLSKQERRLRRLKEIQIASSRVDTRIILRKPDEPQAGAEKIDKGAGNYNLPISEIKKDLWKNLFFTVFAVALVAALKISGFGFDQVKHLLNL